MPLITELLRVRDVNRALASVEFAPKTCRDSIAGFAWWRAAVGTNKTGGGILGCTCLRDSLEGASFAPRKPGDHSCVHCQWVKGSIQAFNAPHPTSAKYCVATGLEEFVSSCPRWVVGQRQDMVGLE